MNMNMFTDCRRFVQTRLHIIGLAYYVIYEYLLQLAQSWQRHLIPANFGRSALVDSPGCRCLNLVARRESVRQQNGSVHCTTVLVLTRRVVEDFTRAGKVYQLGAGDAFQAAGWGYRIPIPGQIIRSVPGAQSEMSLEGDKLNTIG